MLGNDIAVLLQPHPCPSPLELARFCSGEKMGRKLGKPNESGRAERERGWG